ncbi:MAG: SipW-dependent-type signal peptide-containing protein, partial [Clostridia bacterium]|nr:SipW-dependent-type signal peptide-containing protein [Clostridia bacterium]
MTNKTTKRALLSSVLALALCFTMLLGTTFAWFTDSVTSSGNKISSGTLKIDLELLEKDGTWNSIKE